VFGDPNKKQNIIVQVGAFEEQFGVFCRSGPQTIRCHYNDADATQALEVAVLNVQKMTVQGGTAGFDLHVPVGNDYIETVFNFSKPTVAGTRNTLRVRSSVGASLYRGHLDAIAISQKPSSNTPLGPMNFVQGFLALAPEGESTDTAILDAGSFVAMPSQYYSINTRCFDLMDKTGAIVPVTLGAPSEWFCSQLIDAGFPSDVCSSLIGPDTKCRMPFTSGLKAFEIATGGGDDGFWLANTTAKVTVDTGGGSDKAFVGPNIGAPIVLDLTPIHKAAKIDVYPGNYNPHISGGVVGPIGPNPTDTLTVKNLGKEDVLAIMPGAALVGDDRVVSKAWLGDDSGAWLSWAIGLPLLVVFVLVGGRATQALWIKSTDAQTVETNQEAVPAGYKPLND
jgi:hypothetical protein